MSSVSGPSPARVLKASGFTREAVEELSWLNNEPDWLRERRLAAFAAFEAAPWPSGKEEEWRRLDLRSFRLEDYQAYGDPGYRAADRDSLPAALKAAVGTGEAAGLVVSDDSAAVYHTANADLAAKGVVVASLQEAVRDYPELVARHLGSLVKPDADKFAALNGAFWSAGTFVYVPAGVEVDVPVRALHWASTSGTALFNRTLLVVERGGAATVIDDYVSGQDTALLDCSVVELVVNAEAHVRYVTLQDWGPQALSFASLRGVTGRDSELNWLVVALGGKVARSDIHALLTAPGCKQEMLGMFFGDGSQQFDLHTLQSHLAHHTTSDLLFKGVLKDAARSAFSGLIRVAPGAQRTDSYLANRNLLLSDKARADSVPTLEIEANDVRCTHGATVGPIDQDQIFYLMARGIPRGEAERVIVSGFLEPLLARIPLEDVRARLDVSIARKMETGMPA